MTYSKASSYENMSTVKDGSSGGLKQGYLLNLIACRNVGGRAFPVYLDIFHRNVGYTSDNTETYKAIERFMCVHGSKGIWTMDRGYDSLKIMEHILRFKGSFNILLRGDGHLSCGNQKLSAAEIAKSLTCCYSLQNGKYGYQHCYLQAHAVTLIYYKGKYSDLMLLNFGHITKSKIIKQRIGGYFKRWGVEECYRFLKQSFGLERARVGSFCGIRCLLGVSMLAWQVLLKISDDDQRVQTVTNESKMCLTKVVIFDYYRIIKGVMTILSRCVEMYRFRKQNTKHKTLTINDFLLKIDKFANCY